MNVSTNYLNDIVREVLARLLPELTIDVEARDHHIHLSRADVDELFGKGYQLTKVSELSQPGQFTCKERITLIGPKGVIRNVVVHGPERDHTQVEVSLLDATTLGLNVPVIESDSLMKTPGILLMNGIRSRYLQNGLFVAKRHIHMTEADAKKFNVVHKEIVQVKIESNRSLVFDDVVIHVSPFCQTVFHIDSDEAGACGFSKEIRGTIIKKSGDSHE